MTSPARLAVAEKVNAVRSGVSDAGSFNASDVALPNAWRRLGPSSSSLTRSSQELASAVAGQEISLPAPAAIPRVEMRPAAEKITAKQQWEGIVLEISDDTFIARTRDLTDPKYPDEQVTLPREDVAPGDCDLLKIGAVFYWIIGYEENDEGSRKRMSMLRFRRLPAWSERAISRIDMGADELMRLFGPK